ncbi:N-acetyl-gamma-glutamyl-phosphate reductase [Altererythrobacter sp. ZODW24]|uniref:N-acetyl-gamma-glutamyl-phosphate reductase n=1 Tax=Altererythrobacter sp. ZODW24 TaxID=2185142 RepID=UPI000DF76584|nr:N-acetyl-gamma-glutamyl-phosphate reductase [Altererythrobacter sp. ZODW24]
MTHAVFIDGAAGTTGLEIADRLATRPEFELITLADDKRKDASARRDALNAADVAILCLPDDAARESVAMIDNNTTRVIDASTAHRTAAGWTYGFQELTGSDVVASAMRVSNPGCYPTGFLGLVAPLISASMLPADRSYAVSAVSGYSGGGKALIERFHEEADIGWRGYGLTLDHKHLAEMKAHAGLTQTPIFMPAVIRAHRGMVVQVPVALDDSTVDAGAMRAALAQFYMGSNIVEVADAPADGEILLSENAGPWDGMRLHVLGDESGHQAMLVAVLDNLGKGASGAAVQSLNLMAGLDETAGLALGHAPTA